MIQNKVFQSKITKNRIEYKIYNEIAYMGNILTDYENFKDFCLILKQSIDYLKTNNIKVVRQEVLKEDWNNYLKKKTSWSTVNEHENTIMIECNINDCLENIAIGYGIDK